MGLVSTEKKETNVVELEISVDAAALAKAVESVYRRKGKTISVAGFRKGKAPKQIIEKMYGEGIFLEDAVNELYPTAYAQAVEEANIIPVDKAEVEIVSIEKDTGVVFKAIVTVKPEVSIKDYKGIEATKTVYKVTEADIDTEINAMRERNARIITIEDRPAQLDDETIIDFEGFTDGVAFDGGKGEDFSLTLGSKSFIDTFEEQIVGHNVGESFDVNVTFPAEYHGEELKGKKALFKVTLKEIKGKELPEVDDEFVKDISEFDTIDQLKADLQSRNELLNEQRAQTEMENFLIDEMVKNLQGEIPQCMFENKIEDLISDFSYRLSSQGMNLEIYLQYTGMDEAAFRESFSEQAQRQVKIRLGLEKIAEVEALVATDEDIVAEYQKLAELYHMEVDKVKDVINEKDLIGDILANKAVDFVRDNAKITIVETERTVEVAEEETPVKAPAKKVAKKTDDDDVAEEKPAKKPAKKAKDPDAEQ